MEQKVNDFEDKFDEENIALSSPPKSDELPDTFVEGNPIEDVEVDLDLNHADQLEQEDYNDVHDEHVIQISSSSDEDVSVN